MRIPKWGLPVLYLLYFKSYCKKTQKNTVFVGFSNYHYSPVRPQFSNFITLIQLCLNLFTICLPLAHPIDIQIQLCHTFAIVFSGICHFQLFPPQSNILRYAKVYSLLQDYPIFRGWKCLAVKNTLAYSKLPL